MKKKPDITKRYIYLGVSGNRLYETYEDGVSTDKMYAYLGIENTFEIDSAYEDIMVRILSLQTRGGKLSMKKGTSI